LIKPSRKEKMEEEKKYTLYWQGTKIYLEMFLRGVRR